MQLWGRVEHLSRDAVTYSNTRKGWVTDSRKDITLHFGEQRGRSEKILSTLSGVRKHSCFCGQQNRSWKSIAHVLPPADSTIFEKFASQTRRDFCSNLVWIHCTSKYLLTLFNPPLVEILITLPKVVLGHTYSNFYLKVPTPKGRGKKVSQKKTCEEPRTSVAWRKEIQTTLYLLSKFPVRKR